jgi:hypothetical protein
MGVCQNLYCCAYTDNGVVMLSVRSTAHMKHCSAVAGYAVFVISPTMGHAIC